MRGLRAVALAVVASVATPVAAVRAQDLACDPGDVEVSSVQFAGNHTFTTTAW